MNEEALRYAPSGVPAIPALRWGSHVGHLSGFATDPLHILIPYFRAGLENDECCLWVTESAAAAAEARQALRDALSDLDSREESGQIEIIDGAAFYDHNVGLRPDALVAGLLEREDKALAAGFSGLRTNGDCAWVTRNQWPEFRRYEALLQSTIRDRRMICMCSFHPDRLDGPQMNDIIGTHDLVLGQPAPRPDVDAPVKGDLPAISNLAHPRPTNHEFQADIDAIAAIGVVPLLLKIVCKVTGLGFAVVARVTGERWVCLEAHDEMDFGMHPGDELDITTTFCHEIWRSRRGVVIDHVAQDPTYRDHATPAMYGFQSYISMPILLEDGHFFGTICGIDRYPNRVDTADVIGMFRAFADLIAFRLDTRRNADPDDAKRLDARAVAELHDQLVTVLGHDLRNPIAAITGSASLLERLSLNDQSKPVIDIIKRSAARMSAMVDDVTDFARARLGDGLGLSRSRERLDTALRHVADELQIIYPDRTLIVELDITEKVLADSDQVARLASNLLVNALKYGDPAMPVRFAASTNGDFRLSVSNGGPAIPAERIDGLFDPFVRGDVRADQQGLGLGLYIVSEIARAHGGTIQVRSDATETRFTFLMPLE